MSDTAAKLLITFVSVLVAGIPTWIYLFVRWALEPNGFWQDLVLFGVGVYFLGSFQVLLAIALLIWLFVVWFGD